MRCIDADALRDRLQNLGYDDWNQGTTTTWAEAFSECADMVEEMPTIEPRCETCEAFNKTRLLIPQPERTGRKGEPMAELKPCPFCGGDKVNVIEHKFHHLSNSFGVKCFNCKTESYQFFDSRKEAIEAWNRRIV